MPYAARVALPEMQKPTRGYLYDSPIAPIRAVFGTLDSAAHQLDTDVRSALKIASEQKYDPAFVVPFVWGYNGTKITEVNGFGELGSNWPGGNPEHYSWVFVDSRYDEERVPRGCGDGAIVLGKEEEHRRGTHKNPRIVFRVS